jgi:excisionase family DNA binding protein
VKITKITSDTGFGPTPTTPSELLTPSEVATLFRVDPKTVTRWAKTGKLTSLRTLGGHRRYRRTEVYALLYPTPDAPAPTVGDTAPAETVAAR